MNSFKLNFFPNNPNNSSLYNKEIEMMIIGSKSQQSLQKHIPNDEKPLETYLSSIAYYDMDDPMLESTETLYYSTLTLETMALIHPYSIYCLILFLDMRSLTRLLMTSRNLYKRIIYKTQLWKRLCIERYRLHPDLDPALPLRGYLPLYRYLRQEHILLNTCQFELIDIRSKTSRPELCDYLIANARFFMTKREHEQQSCEEMSRPYAVSENSQSFQLETLITPTIFISFDDEKNTLWIAEIKLLSLINLAISLKLPLKATQLYMNDKNTLIAFCENGQKALLYVFKIDQILIQKKIEPIIILHIDYKLPLISDRRRCISINFVKDLRNAKLGGLTELQLEQSLPLLNLKYIIKYVKHITKVKHNHATPTSYINRSTRANSTTTVNSDDLAYNATRKGSWFGSPKSNMGSRDNMGDYLLGSLANNSPNGVSKVLNDTNNSPEGTSNALNSVNNNLMGASNALNGASNSLKDAGNAPNGTSNSPKGASNAPNGTSNSLKDVSNSPKSPKANYQHQYYQTGNSNMGDSDEEDDVNVLVIVFQLLNNEDWYSKVYYMELDLNHKHIRLVKLPITDCFSIGYLNAITTTTFESGEYEKENESGNMIYNKEDNVDSLGYLVLCENNADVLFKINIQQPEIGIMINEHEYDKIHLPLNFGRIKSLFDINHECIYAISNQSIIKYALSNHTIDKSHHDLDICFNIYNPYDLWRITKHQDIIRILYVNDIIESVCTIDIKINEFEDYINMMISPYSSSSLIYSNMKWIPINTALLSWMDIIDVHYINEEYYYQIITTNSRSSIEFILSSQTTKKPVYQKLFKVSNNTTTAIHEDNVIITNGNLCQSSGLTMIRLSHGLRLFVDILLGRIHCSW